MAIKTKAQLKQYFETGKRPTQSQFGDLIDSTVHSSDITKPSFKVLSLLISQYEDLGGFLTFDHVILENTIGRFRLTVQNERITFSFSEVELNLNQIFVTSGLLNSSCQFDKVVLSLDDSSGKELVLDCIIAQSPSKDEIGEILDPSIPGFPLPSPYAFNFLPLEIKIYNSI